MEELSKDPENISLMETIDMTLNALDDLPFEKNFSKPQNIYYAIGKDLYHGMKEKADNGDQKSSEWLENFQKLGAYLKVKFE